jgi:hypothetical protein
MREAGPEGGERQRQPDIAEADDPDQGPALGEEPAGEGPRVDSAAPRTV